jgi:hypothetical protein
MMRHPFLPHLLRKHTLTSRSSIQGAWYRSFHQAKARFTTIDEKGVTVSYATEIRIGGPHDAYIYVDPAVGKAIQSSILRQLGTSTTQCQGNLPLVFDHVSRHFVPGMSRADDHMALLA